jgi:hypothetical protein
MTTTQLASSLAGISDLGSFSPRAKKLRVKVMVDQD